MTWTQTASGGRIDILVPRHGQFNVHDIAHQLARINRFSGAIKCDHYSVAEHSVNCAKAAAIMQYPRRVQLWALLHDAHEICINDISTPTKQALAKFHTNAKIPSPLQMIERELDGAVWTSLLGLMAPRLGPIELQLVKHVDTWMCWQEAKGMLKGGPKGWDFPLPNLPALKGKFKITKGLPPRKAQAAFLKMWKQLDPLEGTASGEW